MIKFFKLSDTEILRILNESDQIRVQKILMNLQLNF